MIERMIVLAALTLFFAPTGAWAQSKNSEHTLSLDAESSSPAAKIEELSWLSGYWRGKGLGGECEEMWGQPIGDRMLGSFSLSKDQALVFSETVMLVEEAGSLILKIKHFQPDFSGWEEKDDFVSFPLVRLGEQEAFFSGLTFQRVEDELRIYVVIAQAGERKEYAFIYQRAEW